MTLIMYSAEVIYRGGAEDAEKSLKREAVETAGQDDLSKALKDGFLCALCVSAVQRKWLCEVSKRAGAGYPKGNPPRRR